MIGSNDDDTYKLFEGFESTIKPEKAEIVNINSKRKINNNHPYRTGFKREIPKYVMTKDDTPLNGWNRIIKSRHTHSDFEAEISSNFNRNFIAGHFDTEKERYFKMWNDKLLNEGI